MKLLTLLIFVLIPPAFAGNRIESNQVVMADAPTWLTESRVERVTDQIERKMEWDIRKIHVTWYSDEAAFEKMHGFANTVVAFTIKKDSSVALGPKVDTKNFDEIFGHELVHIVLGQKYKKSVPSWLEEGLANFLSKHGSVDYMWLAKQPQPDIRTMSHPFKSFVQSPRYQYMASEAVIEMIDSKCGLNDMLQLSVGSSLENYLESFCKISDINAAFAQWLKLKSGAAHSVPVQSK